MIAEIKKCRECNDPVTDSYEGDTTRCRPCARAYQLIQYYKRRDREVSPQKLRKHRGPTLEARANIDKGLKRMCGRQMPGETFTLEEIAKQCDCTRERIRQIEGQALRKVRRILAESEILGMKDLPQ